MSQDLVDDDDVRCYPHFPPSTACSVVAASAAWGLELHRQQLLVFNPAWPPPALNADKRSTSRIPIGLAVGILQRHLGPNRGLLFAVLYLLVGLRTCWRVPKSSYRHLLLPPPDLVRLDRWKATTFTPLRRSERPGALLTLPQGDVLAETKVRWRRQ